MKIKAFFKSKRIIYSVKYQPGQLVKVFVHKRQKYCRIAFTNRIKIKGHWPITDVKFSEVTGIRKLPSPFKVWLYGLVKLKPRATFYKMEPNKTR